MKNFLKEIEERERKNREYKENEKKRKEELEKRKEEQKRKRLEKEKENALKEEQLKKQIIEEKERLKHEEEIKKKNEKEEKLRRLEEDNKRRQTIYSNFRKNNNIDNVSLTDNLGNKISHWDELAKKEENYLKSQKIKEEEKRKQLKIKILKNQYEFRNKKVITSSTSSTQQTEIIKKEDKEKLKQTIEEMCILGDINKKEIIEEKKENPEKFVPIEEAVKTENKKDPLFILGMLAKKLENCGITTAIQKEKEEDEEEKENDESGTSLQFLINGLATKKKYDLHFDISEERNEELLNNIEEQEKFINNLRTKLSKEYNIPEDEIIITNPQRGSFQVSVIFKSQDFNLNIDELREKFKDEKELINLKEVQNDLLYTGIKLKQSILDSRGNNCDGGWGQNEKRGGEVYIPPEGWIGYGLKVLDKYDLEKEGKRNDWLSYDNREGEWCIAYHGVGSEYSSKEVAKAVLGIANDTLKKKSELTHNEEDDDEYDYSEDDDVRHPGQKVGSGVYCSPNPEVMESYAGKVEIDNGTYKMGFMLRVNPDKIRAPVAKPDFWVLNGNSDEVRPYRILIKKVEE